MHIEEKKNTTTDTMLDKEISSSSEISKKKRNYKIIISTVIGGILSLSPFINRALNELNYYEREKIYSEMASLQAQNKYEEAIQFGEEYLAASEGKIEKADAHMLLAFLYIEVSNKEKAEFHAKEAQKIDPQNESLSRYFSTMYTLEVKELLQQGAYEEATKSGETALNYVSAESEKSYLHYLLSLGYAGLGQNEKALAEEKIAMELSTSTIQLVYGDSIWMAKSLWSDGDYPQMVEAATKGLLYATTPEEKGAAHYWLGVGYFRLGQNDEAEKEELLAMELIPDSAGPPVTMAAIYLNRNNPSQALAYAQKALTLDPQYAWAHNARGLALSDLGRKEEASQALEKATMLDPDTALFRLNLTRVREQ